MNKLMSNARKGELPDFETVQATLYRPINQLNRQAQPIIHQFAETASDTASDLADNLGQRVSRFSGLFSRKNQKAAKKAARELRSKVGNRIANLSDSVSHRLADVVDTGALMAGASVIAGKSVRYVRKHPVLVVGGLLVAGFLINQLMQTRTTTTTPEVHP